MSDIIRVPIKIQSDDKGYIDRECPNEECLFNFKIKLDDWKEKVSETKNDLLNVSKLRCGRRRPIERQS